MDDVNRIAKDLKSIRKEIKRAASGQFGELHTDPEILSTKICEMILPKIISILSNADCADFNEDASSKQTYLVHSETSPKTLHETNDENFNQFNFQINAHTNFNTRSQGELHEFKNSKKIAQHADIMQYIFKISSLFTNLLADLIVDVPYYEESRQEIIM